MFLRTVLVTCALAFAAPLAAAPLGDDGLHKAEWMRETFMDLREDLEEATAEGKRLLVIIEQRGCIYCTKMHEEVYPDPAIYATLQADYFVVQLNMFGDIEVTDFDGTVLPEKEMARRWNALFTPMMMFFPEEVPEGVAADDAAVAIMPGAFGKKTTLHLLEWVRDEGYLSDEPFQAYHARLLAAE